MVEFESVFKALIKFLENSPLNPRILGPSSPTKLEKNLKDLTQRKQEEKKMPVSEEMHRIALSHISDTVFITNDSGQFTYICPNVSVIFGYSPKEVQEVGTIFKLIGNAFFDFKALADLGELKNLERPIIAKHGRQRTLLINIKRVSIAKGTILFACRDISEHKQMELALQQSQEHFRQLVENIDQVFWITSADKSKMHYVSPGFERIWGQPCSNLYEHPDAWLDAIHPDDRVKIHLALDKQLQGGYDETYRIIRPDGTVRWIRDRAFPISDNAGKISSVVGIAQDITEEVQLRQESEDRLKQIVQADRLAALGEMVSGVAHEINNPNSFIAYNVPILKETWELFKPILDKHMASDPNWRNNGISYEEYAQDMEEIIDAIHSGSTRISKIVSSLKDFARVDESLQSESVEINRVIESTLTIVGTKIRGAVAVLDLNLDENLPTIQGHFQKLDQVLANLLVNAAHSVRNKVEGKITITTRYVSRLRSVLMEVEDNGEGIDREVRDHIFEPFFTTRRADGGTGLGLSISYGLVREHNGLIGVLSRAGQGSRFSVFLPADPQHEIKIQPTILCVDDDPSVLKVLQSYFIRAKDMAFETTNDPETVVAHLQEHPEIDIVLSDISMPGMDGWALLNKIKTRFPLLNVVLYSGHPDLLQPRPENPFQPEFMVEKSFSRTQLFAMINKIERLIT